MSVNVYMWYQCYQMLATVRRLAQKQLKTCNFLEAAIVTATVPKPATVVVVVVVKVIAWVKKGIVAMRSTRLLWLWLLWVMVIVILIVVMTKKVKVNVKVMMILLSEQTSLLV